MDIELEDDTVERADFWPWLLQRPAVFHVYTALALLSAIGAAIVWRRTTRRARAADWED